MSEHSSDSNAVGVEMHTARRAMLAGIGGLAAGALLASNAKAGPLTPPPGPIASTPGPEPRIPINQTNTPGTSTGLFRITQPGSYYLTGNVTGVEGKRAIEIVVGGVTIDLNGFELVGVAGSFAGIWAQATSLTGITVHNGSVRNWGGDGIDLLNVVNSSSVMNVRAGGNLGRGIVTGQSSFVRWCSAFENAGEGIRTNVGSIVAECTASFNSGNGITGGGFSVITGCNAYANDANGITISGTASTIRDCNVTGNNLNGIVVSSRCLVLGNNCHSHGFLNNDGAGIHVTGGGNRIEGNTCALADRGIDVDGPGNIIIRNTCTGNTTNWTIAAGNSFLIVQANTTASNFSGNAGGGLSSTDPNANFTY